MFIRTKTTEGRTYLQVVESYWSEGKPRQRVIATIGRLDKLCQSGAIDGMMKSLSRFSEHVKICEAYGQGNIEAKKVTRIGPDLILSRLWKDLSIGRVITKLSLSRNFGFSVERAIYLATLSRLFFPGSDRRAYRITRDYRVNGCENIDLHQLYRSMAWLGEERESIEEALF